MEKNQEYQRCTRCIMDNRSDDTITFDDAGVCNYCKDALSQIGTSVYFPAEEGAGRLTALLDKLKAEGKGKKYDAIMGVSGGLDSSYLAYLGKKWGLRILLVHIDDSFDTEISKSNLMKLVRETGFDYKVIKPDNEQYYALTKAYMYAGVPNIAIPQDNVLFAYIYDCMKKNDIHYFLSGGNFALECILQRGNTHDAYDVVNIRDIHKRFGTKPMDKLELISGIQRQIDLRIRKIQSPRPLNYIEYNRERAFRELDEFCGFEYYGRKHLENILTAFIQLYWFPQKFNVDKRTSHLSSMIVSGQISRDEALNELAKPLCNDEEMNEYISLIKQRLSVSDKEFDDIMSAPIHQHTEYKTQNEKISYRLIKAVWSVKNKRK